MTEAEWLACDEPQTMLNFLRGQVSERKLRLFAVFCKREYIRFNSQYADTISSKYVEMTERYADGEATHEEWEGVRQFVHGTFHHADAHYHACQGIDTAVCCCDRQGGLKEAQMAAEYVILANVTRDIFGNPFRPVAFDPAWRTSTAVAIAQGVYESRDFGAMPILADALQDAGCDSGDILTHCRGPGPHVRGCWVVDLVLGKG